MKYYQLKYDGKNADSNNVVFCDECENFLNSNQYIVSEGISLKNNWQKVLLTYDSEEGNVFTDYLDNVLCWLVVSNRFIELTQKYIKNSVEYLTINIKDRKLNSIIDNYKVMNVINVIDDIIDLENTKYIKIYKESRVILGVTKYILKEENIKENHIFKASNDILKVFVSEKIKNIIEENNLTGFYFYEVGLS